jgi:3-phenylpropionate/trans-cinnamate dioxygenase ferredoxin subunit
VFFCANRHPVYFGGIVANFVVIANVNDLKPGQMKSFAVNGKHVLVANWEGTIFATQDLCTHDNGTLADGELIDGEIECPRHGGRFDLKTGAVTALPPMFPIKTFPAKTEGDKILVAIE